MQVPYYEGQISYGYLLKEIKKYLISEHHHNYCYIFILKYDFSQADITLSDFFETFQKQTFNQRSRWLHRYKCKIEKLDYFIENTNLVIYLLGESSKYI